MPAIDLARLKTQAARLSEKFEQPVAFLHDLREVLDVYTNRTIRSAQTAQHLSLATYHTPAPVLRQILSELAPLVEADPRKALALVKALWAEKYLEARLLAARLLGSASPAEAVSSLSRLPDLLAQSTDKKVRDALLTDSLARLRQENPDALFAILEEWLKSRQGTHQAWALAALVPVVSAPGFENLPAVFRILLPALRSAGPLTQIELRDLLVTLDRLFPTETSVYLREQLSHQPPAMLVRTLRRILPAFSPDLQGILLEYLRPQGV